MIRALFPVFGGESKQKALQRVDQFNFRVARYAGVSAIDLHKPTVPIPVLRKVFRRKFVIALKRNFRQDKIAFHGTLKPLAHPKAFSAWLRTLYRHHWHIYSKRPFGGAEQALRF